MNRFFVLLFFSSISLAQVGIGTNTPDPAAVLDVNSQISPTEYGGLKLPTVTIAQRALIPTPIPDGLMIYVSDGTTRCLQLYNSSLGNWLDVYCMNQPPVALSVVVNGTTNVGDVLSTTYDQNNPAFQTDNENDTPDVPLYQWYSNTTPSGLGTAIAGATNATYTIVGGDANNYLSLGITPQAATGASPGIEVRSAYTSQVSYLPTIVEFDPQLATIAENATPDDIDLVFEFPNVSSTAVQVTVTSNDYSRLLETGPVTITIPANQTSPFTTTVFNIDDNALPDGTANLTFTITNVTGGLGSNSIGTDDTDLWDITDDDSTPVATDLFISEYVEGSGNNKYLEIANFTGATVNLANYEIVGYQNGGTNVDYTVVLSGTLADGAVFVIGNGAGTLYTEDLTFGLSYNGNDDIALRDSSTGTIIDLIGIIQATAENVATDETMTRNLGTGPNTVFNKTGEWNVTGQNTNSLGSHTF